MPDVAESQTVRFQFSLQALIWLMTFVALVSGLMIASPAWVRFITAFVLIELLPLLLAIVVIYRPGYERTFCIGALFPSGVTFVIFTLFTSYVTLIMIVETQWDQLAEMGEEGGTAMAVVCGVTYAQSLLFGLAAVGFRWLIDPRQRRSAPSGSPFAHQDGQAAGSPAMSGGIDGAAPEAINDSQTASPTDPGPTHSVKPQTG